MFARDREPVMTGDSQSSQSVQPDVPVAGEPVDSLPQSQDTTRAAEVRPIEQTSFPVSKPESIEHPKDVTQSASVMMLPKWECLKLMQIHKNLGHPSNERLATALRNSGQRPEMVQAAFDLVCPSCLTHTPPKHQRPGSLKPMMDFNHNLH